MSTDGRMFFALARGAGANRRYYGGKGQIWTKGLRSARWWEHRYQAENASKKFGGSVIGCTIAEHALDPTKGCPT